jgi:hypothetical protein
MLQVTQLSGFGWRGGLSFVGYAQQQNTANSTSLIISKPIGTTHGDLMIAFMGMGATGAVTWTGDTGWTEVADQASVACLRVAWKVAESSDGENYTFTSSDARGLSGCILTYTNAAYDTIGSFATAADPTVAPSITIAGGVLLACFLRNSANLTFSTPAGMSVVCSDADATDAPSWAVFSQSAIAGATGAISSSCGNSTSVTGILVSIKPV